MKSRPNITRMNYSRSKGWYVRVPGLPPKLFSDTIHGGTRRALKAAEEYRDSAPAHDLVRCGKAPGPGRVYRTTDGDIEYFAAYIRVAPKRWARTRVSIQANGPRKAKKMATHWLEKKRLQQRIEYEKIGVILDGYV